jgi:hypothetical protein
MTITDDPFRFYPDMPKFKAPALCTQTDPALFTDLPPGVNFRDARKTCSRCEAQPECLQYALTRGLDHDDDGIWGGLGPEERRRLRTQSEPTPTPKKRQPREIIHGTPAGARAHQRQGEKACGQCSAAYQDARQKRDKS